MVGGDEPSAETTALMWALDFQSRVIRDLAAAFGRADRAAAMAMIRSLEHAIADDLIAIRDKSPEGIIPYLREIAMRLRANMIEAKQAIDQAAKLH